MSFEKAVQDEIKRLKDRIAALTSVVGFGNAPRKARWASRKATTRKRERKASPSVTAGSKEMASEWIRIPTPP
jgi:hypothetical protein